MATEAWSPSGRSAGIHDLARRPLPSRFVTAVSLHAHTLYSNEIMTCVPGYLDRIPVVAGLFRLEMRRYAERTGEVADFARGWWHPPLAPAAVLDSEVEQITKELGVMPVVSVTDHDSVTAGLVLQASRPGTPVSFEWTVPFHEGFFHVGVHNLPPALAPEIFEQLAAYTRATDRAGLSDLLQELHADADVLLVLNHPLWDLAAVGSSRHAALLGRFLSEHGATMHALEVNGYRSSRENAGVGALAERVGLPLISGGDRHGYAPNSLLNVTTAACFSEFVHEIREEQVSDIAVMPGYGRPLTVRKLAVAADVVRPNPSNPPGHRHWTDRVSYEHEGVVRQLTQRWPTGGPLWVRSAIWTFLLLTSAPLLPVLAFVAVLLTGAPAGASESGAPLEISTGTRAVPGPQTETGG
jgi:hypothetical protein